MLAHGREPVSARCLESLWTPTSEAAVSRPGEHPVLLQSRRHFQHPSPDRPSMPV